jgi:hypothetical protein
MRVDLYRRSETGSQYSYLVVLAGKPIPEEVTNTDWQIAELGLEISDEESMLPQFAIDEPFAQIDSKGYAITSYRRLNPQQSG